MVCCRGLKAFQSYFLFNYLALFGHVFKHFHHSIEHFWLFIIVGKGQAVADVQAIQGQHAGGGGVQTASGKQVAVGGVQACNGLEV